MPGGLSTEWVRAKQPTAGGWVSLGCALREEHCTLKPTPGLWKLVVVQEGKSTSERPFTVVEGANQVTLARASTSTTIIHLVDQTNVVAGASVWREEAEDDTGVPLRRQSLLDIKEALVGTSDARGEVVLSLVAGQTVKLRATARGYRDSKQVEARSTDSSVTLTLARLPLIRGRVVRDDGAVISAFSIGGTRFEASDGRFALESALQGERGTQILTIQSRGLVAAQRAVELAGVDVDLGDVVLTPGHTVRGRVLDAVTGQPLGGATVFGSEAVSVTNPLGAFELVDQPPGTVEVVAHAPAHAAASARWVQHSMAEVIVRLGPGVSVSGHVANPGLSKYVIAVGPSVEVAPLDDSGSFRFDTLVPGHWTFSLSHFDVTSHAKVGLPLERQSHFMTSLTQHGLKTPLDLGQTAVTNLEVR